MRDLLRKFESNRVFRENEAWLLFRIAAIAEAGGWTLLLTGIALKRFVLQGNDIPVLIAGQFHGMLFLTYITAALGLYPNLNWSKKRAFVAALASIPPYGSLVFEQWAAHSRRSAASRAHRRCVAYRLMLATGTV